MRVRITKYNPVFRTQEGCYQRNEWTSSSEIGKHFGGIRLTLDQYLEVEACYLKVIKGILDLFDIKRLKVANLELYDESDELIRSLPRKPSKKTLDDLVKGTHEKLKAPTLAMLDQLVIKNGTIVDSINLDEFIKLALREILVFQLKGEDNSYIHFGYDYYVYMGIDKKPKIFQIEIPRGIYVEHCMSPYATTSPGNDGQ